MPLVEPTGTFGSLKFPTKIIHPDELLRITRHDSGEPYFGRTGGNRFDDFRDPKLFGTCYFGLSANAAFAETVLHDEIAVIGGFDIAEDDLKSRYVVNFSGNPLQLLELAGHNLKRAGIDTSLTTVTGYDLTQMWSVAVHNHPKEYDGFTYISRHMNTEQAVVLFDRARYKINAVNYVPLLSHVGALRAALRFGVRFI